MAIKMKVVFTAVSVLTAAAAAAAVNFQILAISGESPTGLVFAQLAPPAPTLQVVGTPGGTKTVIAYVTKTAAGEVIIKTLPAVTIYATPTQPGGPTADAGGTLNPTVTSTGGPTVDPIPTVTSASQTAATPTATDSPSATATDTATTTTTP